MTAQHGRMILAMMLAVLVSACSANQKEPELINIKRGQTTPDEFAILPTKPIEIPADLTALPVPRPGVANRVDPTPQADAVAALGGRPERLTPTGAARGDGPLIAQTTRFGTAPDIRQELASADLEFRRKNDGRLLERLFNVTVYYRAYEKQSLDQHQELERFRKAGVRTVAAPPAPE